MRKVTRFTRSIDILFLRSQSEMLLGWLFSILLLSDKPSGLQITWLFTIMCFYCSRVSSSTNTSIAITMAASFTFSRVFQFWISGLGFATAPSSVEQRKRQGQRHQFKCHFLQSEAETKWFPTTYIKNRIFSKSPVSGLVFPQVSA